MIKQAKLILSFLLVTLPICLYSQDNKATNENVNSEILNELFVSYQVPVKKSRVFLSVNDTNKGTKLNPLTYMAGSLLFVYQNVVSEQISASCNYEISCSEYTKQCIGRYGLIKGTLFGLHQLNCCTPTIKKDYCDHQISSSGKIINTIE